MFDVILGQCNCPKVLCNSKPAGRKGKRSEIWELGVAVIYAWGTFDLLMLKVILVLFGVFVSECRVTAVGRNK